MPTIEVNMEDKIPITNVTANPLIGPVPMAYKINAAIRVVTFASKIVMNEIGINLFDIQTEETSLEDIFVKIIKD